MTTLYLVVPAYNEEEVLPWASGQLKEKLRSLQDAGRISKKSRIVFVNDGSADRTRGRAGFNKSVKSPQHFRISCIFPGKGINSGL